MIRLKEQLTWLTALLSSSCCIIQLVLNYFSVSCAGFAIFTPYRPLFTSITILLLTYNLLYHKSNQNKTRLVFSVIFSLLLMMSPEIVQHVNQSSSSNSSITTPTTNYYYRIHLDGLGCEACGNRIKNTLNTIEWISNTRIYFNNQTAIIETIKAIQDSSVIENIIKSIDSTKYNAQVLDSWSIILHNV